MKQLVILPPGAFRLALAGAVVASHVSRLDIGSLAVALFFLLSGFWVSRVFVRDFDGKRWASFYLSRWLRIAPLYLIVLAVAALAFGRTLHWENLSILGVATQSLRGRTDPVGVTWSLDVELQFYLLLPLILPLVTNRRVGVASVAALTAAGWWIDVQFGIVNALMYLPAFAAGMWAEARTWRPGERTALVSLAAFAAFAVLFALLPPVAPFLDKTAAKPFDQGLFAMLWMAPLVPYVAASLRVKSGRLDRDMGNWSYPLYLVHAPILAACVAYGVSKWLGVALACAAALALFYGLDVRLERWRRAIIKALHPLTAPRPSIAAGRPTPWRLHQETLDGRRH